MDLQVKFLCFQVSILHYFSENCPLFYAKNGFVPNKESVELENNLNVPGKPDY